MSLEAVLSRCTDADAQAVTAMLATRGPRAGRPLRHRPKDRNAAIAWTAFRTATGTHNEGDTAFLICSTDEERTAWRRLTDMFVETRKALGV